MSEHFSGQEVQGMEQQPVTRRITREKLMEANKILKKYKAGKARLEARLLEDEKWWRGHAWDSMAEQGNARDPKRPTKWLVNVILGKHADMMDAFPEPVILPREEGDQAEAKRLTSIVPVILEQNHFEDVFAKQAWEKNKHGTAAYAVYWDSGKLNGLGDVNICGIDLLNLFWEPGIEDIQQSRNVFLVSAQDKDLLIQQYPQWTGSTEGTEWTLPRYDSDASASNENKVLVVDWYYRTRENGRDVLQYCKYCGLEVLFASEDDPVLRARGWYDDGQYPFVLDALFPQKGSPAGWGYIDLGRDAQESIDLMDYAIQLNARAGSIPRYFRKMDSGINLNQFLDFTNPVVEVEGGLGEADMVPITHYPLDAIYVQHLNNKIEELKQICGNQDVSNGITSGVTAASAIAAQQEAAGRTSRDGNKGTYRAYTRLLEMVIERIRQFYDVPRSFRILGQDAAFEFIRYDNAGLALQMNPPVGGAEPGWRKPVFDIRVAAQKQNAYSKMAQNELAMQLLQAGVFSPENSDRTLALLSMMDFQKKDELVRLVERNGSMRKWLAVWQRMALELAARYEPETADAMAQGIMGFNELPVGALDTRHPFLRQGIQGAADDAHMLRARAASRNVSQPD